MNNFYYGNRSGVKDLSMYELKKNKICYNLSCEVFGR